MTYWPDRQTFLKDAALSLAELEERARQTSFLVPGLALQITDARTAEVSEQCFRHDGGISEFCEFLAAGEAITDVIRLHGQDRFTETVPMLDAIGHMEPRTSSATSTSTSRCAGAPAMSRPPAPTSTSSRLRKAARTWRGSSALTRTFTDVLQGTRLLKAGEEIVKDDVLEGMTAVITVRLAEPQFEGQTKEVLGTPAVAGLVTKAVRRELTAFLTSTKGTTRAQARQVLEKVVGASRAGRAARQHRDAQRRKNALESSSLPASWWTAAAPMSTVPSCSSSRETRRGYGEVGRNSEFQALLPIRGKILNVQKASVGDMLKNAECASIIRGGGGLGPQLRYRDSPVRQDHLHGGRGLDGAHIRCLLATLSLHAAAGRRRPGVHRRTAAAPIRADQCAKGPGEVHLHHYLDAGTSGRPLEFTKRGLTFKEPQRYKGLGEMKPTSWRRPP